MKQTKTWQENLFQLDAWKRFLLAEQNPLKNGYLWSEVLEERDWARDFYFLFKTV